MNIWGKGKAFARDKIRRISCLCCLHRLDTLSQMQVAILLRFLHRHHTEKNLLLVLNTLILYYSHFIVAVSSHRGWTWSSAGQSAFKCDYKEETTLNNTNNRRLNSLKHVLSWCIQPIANKASTWLRNIPVYMAETRVQRSTIFFMSQRRSFFEARLGKYII